MRSILLAASLTTAFFVAAPLHAQDLTVGGGDSIQQVLAAQKGKRVTVRVGGQELTGTVRDATARLVVLGGITGREFFDAAIPLEKVEAVLVRTKN
jgi:hypothetical protein